MSKEMDRDGPMTVARDATLGGKMARLITEEELPVRTREDRANFIPQ
jgi:hypothetical protein